MKRILIAMLSTLVVSTASADDIDPFSVAHGPITLGPGEEPTESEFVRQGSSIYGGFRLMSPVVEEDAPAGTTATAEIRNGQWTCDAPLQGACVVSWDRGDNDAFDLSQAGTIEFELLETDFPVVFGLLLVDVDENLTILGLEDITQAQSIVLDLQNAPAALADLTRIDNISLTVLAPETVDSVKTVIGPITTAGSLGRTPVEGSPPEVPEEDFKRQIGGNYYDPLRDGEGCQLTLEGNKTTYILTCYVYLEGKQVWLIGPGELTDQGILIEEMVITSGADFGSAFDPADVVRTIWGRVEFITEDCNNATLSLESLLPEFGTFQNQLTKIVPGDCSLRGEQIEFDDRIGNWFDPNRDGEGFQLSMEAGRQAWILTWYTYLGGEQVWLIGSGTENGNRIEFNDMQITSGADFGLGFRAEDVVREIWGTITLEFSDCNNAIARVRPVLPGFESQDITVTRIVDGTCSP